MTRTIFPRASARSECLLAGFMDRVTSHWVRAPPIDGGDDDEDADAGTDTTTPDDDNEDIRFLHQSNSRPDLKLVTVARALLLELIVL